MKEQMEGTIKMMQEKEEKNTEQQAALLTSFTEQMDAMNERSNKLLEELRESKKAKKGGCFGGKCQVETEEGHVPISSLKLGDKVRTIDGKGAPVFTEFLGWMERDSVADTIFLKLTTKSGATISLTHSHALFVQKKSEKEVSCLSARDIFVGDSLQTWS